MTITQTSERTTRAFHDDHFIDGEWMRSVSATRSPVIDPTTELVWGEVPDASAADLDRAVGAAHRAFRSGQWSGLRAEDRAVVIRRLADELEARGVEMSLVITSENGSPVAETSNAAAHSAGILRYYAGLAEWFDAPDNRPFEGDASRYTSVSREAVGVAALIAPWNFPLTLVMVKLAPALLAGCTVVIKPASETPLDLRVLAAAVIAARVPAGVINIITGSRIVGAQLVQHPLVSKVAFTGSTEAGRTIAEQCGRLLRPVTLELGGKSACVVLEDADLDALARVLIRTTLRNTGQTCYNSTRLLAPTVIYERVVDLASSVIGEARQGDPLDPLTVFGPVVSARQRDSIEEYIAIGRAEGARVAVGGGRPSDPDRGFFVEPTVFRNVTSSMRIAREEIFGPVLSIIEYSDEDEAVRIANDSQFGLGGSVFSVDTDRAMALAQRIESGSLGINFYASNHAAPFGGWKDSGLGLEYGPEGVAPYVRLKSIHRSTA